MGIADRRLKIADSGKLPKHWWFYDQLYLFNFRLVWPVTKATLDKYLADEFPDGEKLESRDDTFGGKAIYIPNRDRGSTYIVALREWKGNADHHSALAHECLHIANLILEHREVEVTPQNDEALAYLQQYLVRQCLNVLLPQRLRVVVSPDMKPKRRRLVKSAICNLQSAIPQ